MSDNVVATNLKENTIKMYDNTIDEMEKRGASKEEIDIVKSAKEEAIAAYDYVDEKPHDENEKLPHNCIMDMVNRTIGGFYNFVPLMSNMFIIKMGDIPIYLFQSVSVDLGRKEIDVSIFETPTFSPCKYFSEHKEFGEMKIEFLDNVGAIQRIDLFEGLKVKAVHLDSLHYESDHALTAQIMFKYKKYVPAAC